MKAVFLLFSLLFSSLSGFSQNLVKLKSFAYNWNDLTVEQTNSGERRQIFEGRTNTLAYFEVHVTTLKPGNAPHESHVHSDMEEMIIVKEGKIEQRINGQKQILGPGSVALALPGDQHGISNAGETTASYYILRWKTDKSIDTDHVKNGGGSQYYDWNDIDVRATEKGYHRQFMNRPTSMLDELEMHVTTLKEGISSHGEHIHEAEEMVIITKGTVEKSINGSQYTLGPGSLILLVDKVPHGIKNIGDGPCEYFAFRWE